MQASVIRGIYGNLKLALSGIGLFLPLSTLQAQELTPPAPLAGWLQQAQIPARAAAIHIQELESGRTVYQWNAQQPMNPASVMKLLTTYAALEKLGPTFTWKTTLSLLDAPPGKSPKILKDGPWHGDLVLTGNGDPSLKLERLWLLLRQARQAGLRVIDGTIWLDRRSFNVPEHDPAAFDGEPTRPYNVGADALLLNYQAVQIRLQPDSDERRVVIQTDPQVPLVNQLKLTQTACTGNAWRDRIVVTWQNDLELQLNGEYSQQCGTQNLFRVPPKRDVYATTLLKQLWHELGGSWHGQAKTLVTSTTTHSPIAQIESPPLAEVIREINKNSNNVMARNLFLSLALGETQPATLERARTAMLDILSTRGLVFPELSIENGAGLSRTDRLSVHSLARLLQTAWRGSTMPEFMSSLAVLSQDGTVRSRLNNRAMTAAAHLKTGTLKEVRALAGYLLAASGKRYSYVFVLNDERAEEVGRSIQDTMLEWAYRHF